MWAVKLETIYHSKLKRGLAHVAQWFERQPLSQEVTVGFSIRTQAPIAGLILK